MRRSTLLVGGLAALAPLALALPQDPAPADDPPGAAPVEEAGDDPPAGEPAVDDPPAGDDPAEVAEDDPVAPEEFLPDEEGHAELAAEYFAVCDHDGDGFITFEEAEVSLEVDLDAFAQFDAALGPEGRDGRVSPAEFEARYLETVQRSGAFRPPVPASLGLVPALRTPEQLRVAYDANSDGALQEVEVMRALEDYRVAGVASEAVMAVLDVDRDGQLSLEELAGLATMIEDAVQTLPWLGDPIEATSVVELFGEVTERDRVPGSAPGAPVVVGPVPHFHRLDLDRSGGVDLEDLIRLQSPARLAVRPATVLADLDTDGDGELSEAEFLRAMGEE